jgi:hypothetical protein
MPRVYIAAGCCCLPTVVGPSSVLLCPLYRHASMNSWSRGAGEWKLTKGGEKAAEVAGFFKPVFSLMYGFCSRPLQVRFPPSMESGKNTPTPPPPRKKPTLAWCLWITSQVHRRHVRDISNLYVFTVWKQEISIAEQYNSQLYLSSRRGIYSAGHYWWGMGGRAKMYSYIHLAEITRIYIRSLAGCQDLPRSDGRNLLAWDTSDMHVGIDGH